MNFAIKWMVLKCHSLVQKHFLVWLHFFEALEGTCGPERWYNFGIVELSILFFNLGCRYWAIFENMILPYQYLYKKCLLEYFVLLWSVVNLR